MTDKGTNFAVVLIDMNQLKELTIDPYFIRSFVVKHQHGCAVVAALNRIIKELEQQDEEIAFKKEEKDGEQDE